MAVRCVAVAALWRCGFMAVAALWLLRLYGCCGFMAVAALWLLRCVAVAVFYGSALRALRTYGSCGLWQSGFYGNPATKLFSAGMVNFKSVLYTSVWPALGKRISVLGNAALAMICCA
jgi:hypothetical protein